MMVARFGRRTLVAAALVAMGLPLVGAWADETAFDKQLAEYYRVFIQHQTANRGQQKTMFADKMAAAHRGETVLPEDPAKFDTITETDRNKLSEARAKLMSTLDGGGRDKQPKSCARAQVRYDCWVKQASEGGSDAKGHACHKQFESAFATCAM
jgi:hypothetical protein